MRQKNVKKVLVSLSKEEYEYLEFLKDVTISSSYQDVFFLLLRKLFFSGKYREEFLKYLKSVLKSNIKLKIGRPYRLTLYFTDEELSIIDGIISLTRYTNMTKQVLIRYLIIFEWNNKNGANLWRRNQ